MTEPRRWSDESLLKLMVDMIVREVDLVLLNVIERNPAAVLEAMRPDLHPA